MADRARLPERIRSSDPGEVRKRQIAIIMECCDEPTVGKYFLKYGARLGRQTYIAKILRLSNDALRKECDLADISVKFLRMGLLVQEGFLDPETMSREARVEYRAYCRDMCKCLREVDLDHPPGFLKLYSGITSTERRKE